MLHHKTHNIKSASEYLLARKNTTFFLQNQAINLRRRLVRESRILNLCGGKR